MNLYEVAAKTYDNIKDKIGIYEGNKIPLAPICHDTPSTGDGCIEILLDADGNFISAKSLEFESQRIIVPVTESSMGRSKGIAPHPLTDQVKYIFTDNEKAHSAYISQLDAFAKYTNDISVKAVYLYITKHNVKKDIEVYNFKIKDKTMITWCVVENEPIYSNKDTFDAWIDYYTNVVKKDTSNKGTMKLVGNGKLVSANNESVYAGRFLKPEEVCSREFETTQKAERFLKWIIANEGVWAGGTIFICWNPKNGVATNIDSPFSFMKKTDRESWESYKHDFKDLIHKVCADKSALENVVVVGLDHRTDGRLAVAYCNKFNESDFYNRISTWDKTCGRPISLSEIIKYAYGDIITKEKTQEIKVSDGLFLNKMKWLISCRLSGGAIPRDLMQHLFNNFKRMHLYKDEGKNKYRTNLIKIATIMANKYYIDNKKGEFDMVNVEEKRMDRSYQFGRILAIYEEIEKKATKQDNRDTTALKMEEQYCRKPASTLIKIREHINKAYIKKLDNRDDFEKMIREIIETIEECGGWEDKPLTESFMVGYAIQRNSFFRNKKN